MSRCWTRHRPASIFAEKHVLTVRSKVPFASCKPSSAQEWSDLYGHSSSLSCIWKATPLYRPSPRSSFLFCVRMSGLTFLRSMILDLYSYADRELSRRCTENYASPSRLARGSEPGSIECRQRSTSSPEFLACTISNFNLWYTLPIMPITSRIGSLDRLLLEASRHVAAISLSRIFRTSITDASMYQSAGLQNLSVYQLI